MTKLLVPKFSFIDFTMPFMVHFDISMLGSWRIPRLPVQNTLNIVIYSCLELVEYHEIDFGINLLATSGRWNRSYNNGL